MRKTLLIISIGALTLSSALARAQDAESVADVRCLVIGIKLAQMADPTQQSAGMMLSMYYMGRLDGHAPRLDLEKLLIKQLGSMTASDYGSEAKRCGGALQTRGQDIAQIGKDMVEKGQKMMAEEAK